MDGTVKETKRQDGMTVTGGPKDWGEVHTGMICTAGFANRF